MKIRDFICLTCNLEFTVINSEVPEFCDECYEKNNYKALLEKVSPFLDEKLLSSWLIERSDFKKKVQQLYHMLFPEDYWFQNMDNKNFDHMSDEYLEEVNNKRSKLGIRTNNIDGSEIDLEAVEVCKKMTLGSDNFFIYDFIGDVHGKYSELTFLLLEKGYDVFGDSFYSTKRRAIFVGDFVDKGPESLKVLKLVKSMCDSGCAMAVLGNHDWNWIRFNTSNGNGGYLREHSPDNLKQNKETRMVWKNAPESEKKEILLWLSKLPFWIKTASFGVIHACWDEKKMDKLQHEYNVVSFDDYHKILIKEGSNSEKIKQIDKAIDCILCGPEIPLPDDISFIDDSGKIRTKVRLKWWALDKTLNLEEAIVKAEDWFEIGKLKHLTQPKNIFERKKNQPSIFFGHYALKKMEHNKMQNFYCLDLQGEKIYSEIFTH